MTGIAPIFISVLFISEARSPVEELPIHTSPKRKGGLWSDKGESTSLCYKSEEFMVLQMFWGWSVHHSNFVEWMGFQQHLDTHMFLDLFSQSVLKNQINPDHVF